MNRRIAAVALAVVLVGGSVVALVADPLASEPEPVTVDATATSPDELAFAALETPERRSYAVKRVSSRSPGDNTRVLRVRVDRTHRRIAVTRYRTPGGEPYGKWFIAECTSASSIGPDVSVGGQTYGDHGGAFYTGDVELSELEATVVDRSADQVAIRVTNTSAAASIVLGRENPREWIREEDIRGNLTVTWNTEESVLDRVEYVHSSRVNETHRETFRRTWTFQEWGRVHVDRPGWAGYTNQEFLCDVTTFRT